MSKIASQPQKSFTVDQHKCRSTLGVQKWRWGVMQYKCESPWYNYELRCYRRDSLQSPESIHIKWTFKIAPRLRKLFNLIARNTNRSASRDLPRSYQTVNQSKYANTNAGATHRKSCICKYITFQISLLLAISYVLTSNPFFTLIYFFTTEFIIKV